MGRKGGSRLSASSVAIFVCFVCLSKSVSCIKASDDNSHEHFQSTNNSTTARHVNNSSSTTFQKRQDTGFDLLGYFLNGNEQQQQQQQEPLQTAQQQVQQQQQLPLQQAPSLVIQQQFQLQQQQLQQQQQRDQKRLRELQEEQLRQQIEQLQQLHQQHLSGRTEDSSLHQQQPANGHLNRDGYGYGDDHHGGGYNIDVSNGGGGYHIDQAPVGHGYANSAGGAYPKETVAFTIGNDKPALQIGNVLSLLPRIINILSGGGKVMFGVELGKNFYFGPVGAKPLAQG